MCERNIRDVMRIQTAARLSLLLIYTLSAAVKGTSNITDAAGETHTTEAVHTPAVLKSSFHVYREGNLFEETCAIVPFRWETLERCAYNTSNDLVLIIHGWTMNGIMEQWIFSLASALKFRMGQVNVIISDWRSLALQAYPIAAKNSRQVGRDVATLLEWLEKAVQLSMDKVHLIGYSLGAHAAGFAGSHFRGRKVGRITGLDPAGPHFEGVPAFDRLSHDDAQFVDVIHTFAKSNIMPGVGINQIIGHVDFYPNGGTFQPGCKMLDIYSNVYQYGLQGVPKTIKCSHERAVKLYTESLLNTSQPITGFRCRGDSTFNKGLCLDCKQDRCNTLGYDIRRGRAGKNTKGLYFKTGAETPYKVLHYQIRVLLMNVIEPVEASVSITLNGTGGESGELPITLYQESSGEKIYTSLLTVSADLGHLTSVGLVWRGELVWSSWLRRVRNIMTWNEPDQRAELSVWRICIKSGEKQEKVWFCASSGKVTHLKPSQEHQFIRCDVLKRKPSSHQEKSNTTRVKNKLRDGSQRSTESFY
ncbi:hepatic triacylglycerol lipase-like isoform X2 [Triplophysa rosa]|uniref:Hepatic triacylglycerol lipase-like n=1 Tax=Triplophysa rosa TaxID=992332 RepID=A0A9W7X0U3_TRIRA|nr:hepatic triacylglycerol lipase-like isoform X2 [Triplophysa rosa]KAI7811683.1 putative hepatic triacylglycerol lipase-like [Triplophysa rosa]